MTPRMWSPCWSNWSKPRAHLWPMAPMIGAEFSTPFSPETRAPVSSFLHARGPCLDQLPQKGQTTITANLRLSGGATRTLVLPRPLSIADIRRVKAEIVAEVDHLLNHHNDPEIAEILNSRGFRTGEGLPYDARKIHDIRKNHNLSSRPDRLRRLGMLTTSQLADHFEVSQ